MTGLVSGSEPRASCPVGPYFTLSLYYFFMKTCDVRQCIKNLNGFSFSASILCNVIKMRQLIWSFWLNIQFKTYRPVLRGWPMVFWDKFKHSQPRCRRTLLFLLYMSPKPSLYTWKDHCIAFMTFRSVSVTTSGWTKPKFAIICRHSSIVFSEKNGKHQSRKYKDAVSGWERNAMSSSCGRSL